MEPENLAWAIKRGIDGFSSRRCGFDDRLFDAAGQLSHPRCSPSTHSIVLPPVAKGRRQPTQHKLLSFPTCDGYVPQKERPMQSNSHRPLLFGFGMLQF